MGYTHYYETKKPFTKKEWQSIQDYTKKVIEIANKIDIKICDGLGEAEPIINEEYISINGSGDLSHETFSLDKDEKGSNFCKTNRKPYDLIVTSILSYVKQLTPDKIEISSDGGSEVFESYIIDVGVDGTLITVQTSF
jgi:hypothetical protein